MILILRVVYYFDLGLVGGLGRLRGGWWQELCCFGRGGLGKSREVSRLGYRF